MSINFMKFVEGYLFTTPQKNPSIKKSFILTQQRGMNLKYTQEIATGYIYIMLGDPRG